MPCNPVIDLVYDFHAQPEVVWRALTDPELTAQYWCGMRVQADAWVAGATMRYVQGGRVTDEHTLVHVERPWSLAFRFHPVFSAEMSDELASMVHIYLCEHAGGTRLRLHHDGFARNSVVYPSCRLGWPRILDRLKIMLDSGRLRVLPSAPMAPAPRPQVSSVAHAHLA